MPCARCASRTLAVDVERRHGVVQLGRVLDDPLDRLAMGVGEGGGILRAGAEGRTERSATVRILGAPLVELHGSNFGAVHQGVPHSPGRDFVAVGEVEAEDFAHADWLYAQIGSRHPIVGDHAGLLRAHLQLDRGRCE